MTFLFFFIVIEWGKNVEQKEDLGRDTHQVEIRENIARSFFSKTCDAIEYVETIGSK